MAEIQILTDPEIDAVLNNGQPTLILFADDGVRSDFRVAFEKTAQEKVGILFGKLNPTSNPLAAERFGAGGKPLLIGWFNGEEILRRSRPWGTDVVMAVEALEAAYKEQNPDPEVPEQKESEEAVSEKNGAIVDTKPVVVTDQTFQAEVIDHELPVLVDFWAEWCGPCRMVAPILEKLAEEYAGQIRIAKVDVDQNPGLSQTFKIMSIPTIMAVKDQTIVFSQPGALPEPAFRSLIDQLIALEVPQPEANGQNPN